MSNLAKKELAKRELARRGLIRFVKYNFPSYDTNWHHQRIAEKLEAVERGEIKRLMIFMPPRHGKSELASVQFPAWFLGKNPEKEIIAVSYSADLSISFGRRTRNLVRQDEYQNVFKGVTLAEDSKSAATWNTNKGGSYIAVGVGGAITGKGADILLIDDPVKNREDAESDIIRDKTWDWYRSTAYTRLSPGGAIVVIQTRWHDADLSGMLLDDTESGDKWEVVSFPAVATEDEKFRKAGEPLWPGTEEEPRYPLERLEQIKRVIGSYEWSSLYQQDPVDEDSQEFRREWFKNRSIDEVTKLATRKFLTIDTAISQKAAGDFTGWIENFVDQENNWNIRARQMKVGPGVLIDKLFESYATHRWEKIGIEKTIYYDSIKEFLDDEMRKRGVFLPIVELSHQNTKKELRIRGLIPRYERNSIYHIDDTCHELEEELVRFPKGRHDDLADALAYQIQLAEQAYPQEIGGDLDGFGLYSESFT